MKYLWILLFGLTLSSCSENSGEIKRSTAFFDLKGYFEKEAIRLQKENPEILKTASRNGKVQTKRLKNIDWKAELNLFSESDINKSAWKDSYKITEENDNLIYLALDSNLRTRRIIIRKTGNQKIQEISIENKTINRLYQSYENLVYNPDSLYQIKKKQNVLIIGENDYLIKGLIH